MIDIDVSVIIVNYNTKELTANCIASVISHTSGVSYEIILVDNASTDGSVEEFEKYDNIKFLRSNSNLGFGKANNLGRGLAKGKYLLLLNSDTLLLNNAIKDFFDYMEKVSDNVACLGCLLVDSEGNRIHSYGSFPRIINEIFRRPLSYFLKFSFVKAGFDVPTKVIDRHSVEVEYVTGADLFVRSYVADRFGLFDPSFFMYYEETEMQYRYRKNGFVSRVIDTPRIMHLVGGSQKKNGTVLWRTHDVRSMLNCYRKIHGVIWARLFKFIIVIMYIPLAFVDYRCSLSTKYNLFKSIFRS